MKVKIIRDIPVQEQYKPKVGEIYEVSRSESRKKYIRVNGEEVGLFFSEYLIVE